MTLNDKKILIVDDVKINRLALSKILESEYTIIEAINGKDAIEKMKDLREQLSLIILDIVMPEMDGYEFLEYKTSNKVFNNIPVVVITQQTGEAEELKALEHGAIDFLTKPFNSKIIKHKVATIVKMRETAALVNAIEKDSTTSVYTKEALYQKTQRLIRDNLDVEFDVVCFDIENFKLINERYGEKEGDRVLLVMARAFDKLMTKQDGYAGRFGGDVFMGVCKTTKHLDPFMVARNFEKFLNRTLKGMNISVKCGLYHIEDRNLSVRLMYDNAKYAVETVKGKYGKIIAVFDKAMESQRRDEMELNAEMIEALSKHQFRVYCQPKFELETKKLIGAEALVRWEHPQKGLISPNRFIPIFEKNGFIMELDKYVWEMTCSAISKWMKLGHEAFPISVNLSRVDLNNSNLVEILVGIVEKYQVPPKYLHIEITESAYTENEANTLKIISNLRAAGFIIEMDDFGSGYSSLTLLKDACVDIIKLDKGFISGLREDDDNFVLKHIISLCKDLELPIIAEGIETKEELEILADLGCMFGQGYYYSKPLAPPEFAEFIKNAKIRNFNHEECPKGLPVRRNIRSIDGTLAAQLSETMPCGIVRFTLGGKIMFCNTIFARCLEFENTLDLNKTYETLGELVTDKTYDAIRETIDRNSVNNLFEPHVKCQFKAKDGSIKESFVSISKVEENGSYSMQFVVTEFTLYKTNYDGNEKLKAVLKNIPGGIIKYKDGNGKVFEYASDTIFEMFGYDRQEILEKYNNNFEIIIHPKDKSKLSRELREQFEDGDVAHCEHRIITKDHKIKWVYSVTKEVIDAYGEKWFYVILIDTTTYKRLEKRARLDQKRLENILPYTNDIVFEIDFIKQEILATDNFKETFGYDLEVTFDGENRESTRYITEETRLKLKELIFESIDRKGFGEMELQIANINGDKKWYKINLAVTKNINNELQKMVGIIVDINSEKLLLQQMRIEATRDSLTRVLNRKNFEIKVKDRLEIGFEKNAFVIVDIDNFKGVNDSMGHQFGDNKLKHLSEIITSMLRNDDVIGRLGGDEFAFFITGIGSTNFMKERMEILIKRVKDEAGITISAGVAVSKDKNTTFERLYALADEAMYEMKKQNKNGFTIKEESE
ncbi:MAG: EAL domain-containing protein [Anaerovoracaceae bacterium]